MTEFENHPTFKCGGLCMFTIRSGQTVDLKVFRKYFKNNWKMILKGMTKPTVLFIGGVHGGATGKVGTRAENMEGLEKDTFIK